MTTGRGYHHSFFDTHTDVLEKVSTFMKQKMSWPSWHLTHSLPIHAECFTICATIFRGGCVNFFYLKVHLFVLVNDPPNLVHCVNPMQIKLWLMIQSVSEWFLKVNWKVWAVQYMYISSLRWIYIHDIHLKLILNHILSKSRSSIGSASTVKSFCNFAQGTTLSHLYTKRPIYWLVESRVRNISWYLGLRWDSDGTDSFPYPEPVVIQWYSSGNPACLEFRPQCTLECHWGKNCWWPVRFKWSYNGIAVVFQCVSIMQMNTGSPLGHHWVLAIANVVSVASKCTCGSSGLPVCSNYAN